MIDPARPELVPGWGGRFAGHNPDRRDARQKTGWTSQDSAVETTTITPRQRVERCLLRRRTDKVPFTIYEDLMPRCDSERQLRNDGMCLVTAVDVLTCDMPNVRQRSEGYFEDGQYKLRWFLETPQGTLTTVNVPQGYTTWHEKRMFTSPDDYKAVAFVIKDRLYKENYKEFLRIQAEKGEDFHCRTAVGYEPMQEIIVGIMGVETFCIEWMERRDEVLRLYDLIVETRRKQFELIAESPALCVNYGGNVSPEIVGLERFRDYYVDHYNEMAEILHKRGKLVGVHLDANNKLLAPEVARTSLDYIEAFTPPPDCDMSVAEAMEQWPDKIIWINFPSSVHLADDATIRATTREILEQSVPGDRLIVGVTEDVPQQAFKKSLTAISETINEDGVLPLQ